MSLSPAFEELNFGFIESYKSTKNDFVGTTMFLFVIFSAFSSISIVLNQRQKRNRFNSIVLSDSNQKLDDLIWLLKVSIKQIDNPNFRATGTFFNPREESKDQEFPDIDKQTAAVREKKKLLGS